MLTGVGGAVALVDVAGGAVAGEVGDVMFADTVIGIHGALAGGFGRRCDTP
jgi:hypothetical protein